jgi:dolichol-phosphate mannosyltransferase
MIGDRHQTRSLACLADLAQAKRFAKFAIVGMSGVAVNSGVLYVLVTGLGLNPVLGAVVSTEIAILGNFALNDLWTFGDSDGGRTWVQRMLRYNAVVLGGLVLAVVTLAVVMRLTGAHYLVANMCGIVVGTLWNYAANCRLTWRVALTQRSRSARPVEP